MAESENYAADFRLFSFATGRLISQPLPERSPQPGWQHHTWPQPAPPPQPYPQPARTYTYIPQGWPKRWRWLAAACLDSREFHRLHHKDRKFLSAIVVYRSTPCAQQLRFLQAIAELVLT